MIFRFVVRRLRWLARVPLLPQWFDAALLLATAMTARAKLRAIEQLEKAACEELRLTRGIHRFGGTGFYRDGAELGHVHGNGLVDVLVGRAERERLVASGKAQPHHIFPSSGWISFHMKSEADVSSALELLRVAAQRKKIPARVGASPGAGELE